ncbi:MAG: N-glycosylase/DNA lyase [Candidatus Micrarchaeia archaeon]
MEELLYRIRYADDSITALINKRWAEFQKMKNASENDWFSELCFCILTANASAEMGIRVQNALGYEGFAKIPAGQLPEALKKAGSRFYNRRAEFIIGARKFDGKLKEIILGIENEGERREWLVKNIKGIGYKEASHFLRNVGAAKDVAIIDKHILRLLKKHKIIGETKKMAGREKYIEIENAIKKIAKKADMPVGKLDLYLWHMQTGKVLK